MTNIRFYNSSDKNAIIELFRLNTPLYFSPDEEADLDKYLENELELYFVLENEGEIVGCGGINFPDQNSATISWDLFHPDFHGKGFGSKLLRYRLDQLKELQDILKIKVRTSQLVYQFYEKNGFKLLRTEDNYWAEGFHLYEMELGE